MHRQQQEPSLYSSAAPKGACKPHCSHIDKRFAMLGACSAKLQILNTALVGTLDLF